MRGYFIIFLIAGWQSCSVSHPMSTDIQSPYLSTDQVQLSPPFISPEATLFEDFTSAIIEPPIPGSKVCYTHDGSVPDLDSPQVSNSNLIIDQSGEYQFRAFHCDFLSSEIIKIPFYKIEKVKKIKTITSTQSPNEKYKDDGWMTLTNMKRGDLIFSSGWLGFQEEEINLQVLLAHKDTIEKVTIGLMSQQGAWIFLPESVRVLYDDRLIAKCNLEKGAAQELPHLPLIELNFDKPIYTDHLEVKIVPYQQIPEWHDGKGTTPWTFMDEIIIQ